MLFQTSKNILFKLGATKQLGEIMVKERCKHVCIVTDKGIRNAGLIDDGVASLKAAGVEVTIFDEVVPDPLESNIYDGTKLCIDNGVDGIIGFGGGSSMDVAKVIAYLTKEENHGTKLDDIYGVGVAPGGRIPLVQVPTTAGTGSEVTQISVVKRSETVKAGIVSPTLLPDWAVLDGALTCSCP